MRGCPFCCPSDASDEAEAEASCASGDGAVDDDEEEDDDDEDANVRPANVHEVAPPSVQYCTVLYPVQYAPAVALDRGTSTVQY